MNNILKKIFEKDRILNFIYIIFGCGILAISFNMFLLPNKLSTGGANGIATVIYYLYKIPANITILLINIPLFIISIRILGIKFMVKAILSTLLYIFLVGITSSLKDISWLVPTDDKFISAIFGGVMSGIGLSLIFKAGASTGGTDLLAQIINKKITGSSTSKILLIIDGLVVITSTIFFKSVTIGLYSIIAIFLSKKVIEILFEGMGINKEVNVITKYGKELSDEFRKKVERGVTLKKCEKGYEDEEYYQVTCIVTTSEITEIKKITKRIDKKAFMYISNTNEVMGLGFKKLI